MSTMFQRSGRLRSGKPSRAVEIALAWISGPDMTEPVGVAWMSWSEGAVAPMTTTLSLNTRGGTFPSSTREYEYELTVPGRAGVVDPLVVASHLLDRDRPAVGDLRPDDREPLQALHLVGEAADDPVLVGGQVRVARPRAELLAAPPSRR